jgi:RNA polymerase sigma factor (sigma-70 family)
VAGNMTAFEDQEWIRLLKQGDENALDRLFKVLYEISVKICKSRGQDEQVAYDVAAKAYDRIMAKGIISFDFRSKFTTFCYTVVSHELYRIFRKYEREQALPDDDQEKAVESTRADQIIEILKICLDKLDERERICILNYYIKEDDPVDIAVMLGISRIHVNVINHKVRFLLKQCLESRGYMNASDVMGSLISL